MKLIVCVGLVAGAFAYLSADGNQSARRLERRLETAIETTYGKQVMVRPKALASNTSAVVTGSNPPQKAAPSTALLSAINHELRRLGCHHGAASAEWTSDSQQALIAFNRHIDAQMPVDRPDATLLTILRGFSAPACLKSTTTSPVLSEAEAWAGPARERTAAVVDIVSPQAAGVAGRSPSPPASLQRENVSRRAAVVVDVPPRSRKAAAKTDESNERRGGRSAELRRSGDGGTRVATATVREKRPARQQSSVAFNARSVFDRMNKS